ncbi:MAG TPA: hypothetical protein VGL76_08105 [Gaiellaceae bacterium]|jgi:hypothetical protein
MHLTFLTPIGAVAAAGALIPLAALVLQGRRAGRVRMALRLDEPSRRSRATSALALALVPALLGLALAQPVLRSTSTVRVRRDAEAFYVFDISDSMNASASRTAPTRLERSIGYALRMRLALPQLRSGVATFTDRVLPDLFPTADEEVFTATIDQAIGIDDPPAKGLSQESTTFAALDNLVGTNFFDPGIKHRLVVLFTDGETAPYLTGQLDQALHMRPRMSFVIVHVWRSDERIYTSHGVDSNYRPNPQSTADIDQLVQVSGGRAFDQSQIGAAISAARKLIGHGPTEKVGEALRVIALARWLALAALAPIAFLFWRRTVA